MANEAHLRAILSAVDRISPTLGKIAASVAGTKGALNALNSVGFNRLRGNLRMLDKGVRDVGGAARESVQNLLPLVGLGGLSVAGLGVGFFAGARGAMAYSAGIQDASDITGEAFERLQQLQGAFRLGGVEAESTNEAIVKFNKGMAEAAAGKDKGFAGLMARLRIPLRNAKGEIRAFSDVLPEFADGIEKNQNPAIRTRMLMEAFGKTGAKLAPVLKDGGKALLGFMAAQQAMGKVLSEQSGGALDKLDENLEELGVQYRVLSGEVLARAAPAVMTLVQRMQTWIASNRELIRQRLGAVIERIANAFAGWIESGGFERLTTEISRAWTVMGEFIDRLGGLGNLMKLLGLLILAGPLASLVALGGAMTRLGLVVVPILFKSLGLLIGPLVSLFGVITAGQAVVLGMSLTLGQLALLAAPFVLAAAAIAGGAYLIYRNWDVVGPFLARVWEGIKTVAASAWNVLRFLFSWSPLGVIVNNWGAISAWIGGFWESLKETVAAGITLVGAALQTWAPIAFVKAAWDPVVSFLSGVWDRISGIIGPVLRLMGGGVGALASFAANSFSQQFGEGAAGREYGPRFATGPAARIPATAMQGSARVHGDMRVTFENAPQGMRVAPGTTTAPGLGFNPDVQYRNMGGIG